jgi:hypothetical protein
MILVETPANPTNGLVDLAACKMIADELEKSQGIARRSSSTTPCSARNTRSR